MKNHAFKGGLPVFRYYSKLLADTQTLVDFQTLVNSWGKYQVFFSIVQCTGMWFGSVQVPTCYKNRFRITVALILS